LCQQTDKEINTSNETSLLVYVKHMTPPKVVNMTYTAQNILSGQPKSGDPSAVELQHKLTAHHCKRTVRGLTDPEWSRRLRLPGYSIDT
jgi:hypothetical protein